MFSLSGPSAKKVIRGESSFALVNYSIAVYWFFEVWLPAGLGGQLYRGHANATALFSSSVVSALGCESDDPGSSPGTCGKKNTSSTLRLG